MTPMYDMPDYFCPLSKLPFNESQLPDWNIKSYNPLCRAWYKEAAEAYPYNLFSVIYKIAGSPIVGISECSPVIKRKSNQATGELYAAVCEDIRASGFLEDYFEFEKQKNITNFCILLNKGESYS